MEISFKMIRESSNILAHLSPDELLELEVIRLESKNINEIDNLEPFGELRELHLSDNKIETVENLEFLTKLEVLNLGYNTIHSSGLIAENLPKSLKVLNISGNPCVSDEELLLSLRRTRPDLRLVLDDPPPLPSTPQPQSSDEASSPSLEAAPEGGGQEDLLHHIVSRRVMLDTVSPYDFQSISQAVHEEGREGFGTVRRRQQRTQRQREEEGTGEQESVQPSSSLSVSSSFSPTLPLCLSVSDSRGDDKGTPLSARIESLLTDHKKNGTDSDAFLSNLRERATQLLATRFPAQLEGDAEKQGLS
mmetsp:Transcript_5496/g.5672  ORF Transcript_5496/g.5672 Transcript_5496/m.5672 type:complete len:305 (+) Transcript_5496:208-1122(+)|eukprot:CAMPEP_0182424598 /NCGR_PEP_ID=MMETSP1167-20130531/10804_1 /TAXON_ID=2988 /ORGANISM="Mallomonas Sp, Strain CCMP3275" /LENGTH=304 /DNA_ID=CAMNT_0024604509 /DNA_START=190 /DNA_END=1104 /DNA_ORIENTATION=+